MGNIDSPAYSRYSLDLSTHPPPPAAAFVGGAAPPSLYSTSALNPLNLLPLRMLARAFGISSRFWYGHRRRPPQSATAVGHRRLTRPVWMSGARPAALVATELVVAVACRPGRRAAARGASSVSGWQAHGVRNGRHTVFVPIHSSSFLATEVPRAKKELNQNERQYLQY